MNCKSCGAEITEQATFCTNCGTKIEEPAAIPLTEDKEDKELDIPVDLEEIPEAKEETPEEKQEQPESSAAFTDVPYAPYTVAVAPPAGPVSPENKPVSTAVFFWLLLFSSLPVIGLFVNILIVSRAERVSLKNFCIAMLIWQCIFLFLLLVGLVLGIIYLDYVNDFLSRYFDIMILPQF
jgi:hypothetical protein